MEDFSFLLPDLRKKWEDYIVLCEKSSYRGDILLSLQEFLNALQKTSAETQEQFAYHYLTLHRDKNHSLPMHYPLFAKVLAPYLLSQISYQKPPFLRWTLGFYFDFIKSSEFSTQLLAKFPSFFQMIDLALEQEAHHPWLIHFYIEQHAQMFRYSIHEVPSGVLSGPNGATKEDCQKLLKQLEGFTNFVKAHNQFEQFADLIKHCQFYFQTYHDYLQTQQPHTLYETYLTQFDIPL